MYSIIAKDGTFLQKYKQCSNYTITTIERMYALYKAILYIEQYAIAGDIVECGVYKGGSMMLCALTLCSASRRLWLYDTFNGMPPPDPIDKCMDGNIKASSYSGDLAYGLAEVANNMKRTNYPQTLIKYIQGPVEQTVPANSPEQIALLRLDTDWYASTAHEMRHLFHLISPGGVLIIDDYGYWEGCKTAIDEYIHSSTSPILLTHVDKACVVGVKVK